MRNQILSYTPNVHSFVPDCDKKCNKSMKIFPKTLLNYENEKSTNKMHYLSLLLIL